MYLTPSLHDALPIFIFNIVEGPRVKVRNVVIRGNKSFTDNKIKEQVKTKPSFLFFSSGVFDPDQIDADVANIRQYYENHGFFEDRKSTRLNSSHRCTSLLPYTTLFRSSSSTSSKARASRSATSSSAATRALPTIRSRNRSKPSPRSCSSPPASSIPIRSMPMSPTSASTTKTMASSKIGRAHV